MFSWSLFKCIPSVSFCKCKHILFLICILLKYLKIVAYKVLCISDSSLIKIMETHSSSIVTNEVKKLIVHWKLDVSLKHPNIVEVNKKHSMSENNLGKNSNNKAKETITVCTKSEPLRLTNAKCVTSVAKIQPVDKSSILNVCAKAEEKNKDVCSKTPSFHQVCKTNTAIQVSKANTASPVCKTNTDTQVCKAKTDTQVRKMQTPKQICRKSSVNEIRKSEVTRRLHFAMQLFMEEVGKQEVKMYLEALT